ncbi:MAG: hypothetical protein Fur0022_24350 [Anaerolineales bacterium]
MKFSRLLLALGLVFLAGCAQVFPTAQSSELPTPTLFVIEPATEIPEVAEADVETPTSMPPTEDAETTPEAVDVPPTPTEQPTTAPPTDVPAPTGLGSPELHATDPLSVNLASGKVQLVEFFAFW